MNRQIQETKTNTVTTREFSALIKKFQVSRKLTKTRIANMFPLFGETVISKFKGITIVTEMTRTQWLISKYSLPFEIFVGTGMDTG
jgi:hypothetical protein